MGHSTFVRGRLALSLVSVATIGCFFGGSGSPKTIPRPTLVVLITVDQLSPEYLERFRPQLNGGIARLLQGGAVFVDAHHDHAITETAPGHATLLSGRYPRSTGITRNVAGVNDPKVELLGSTEVGASPFRFQGTTLFDWLRAADSNTLALSVSGKDRGAILPIGRAKTNVFWYLPNGEFSTSTWYSDTLPWWVQKFNARLMPQSFAARVWTLLRPASAYPEPDSVPAEGRGQNFQFPHQLPSNPAEVVFAIRTTPMWDEVVSAMALAGLTNIPLGKRRSPDLLAVSFSATDYIGHTYGPDSREQHDQILRLDRTLGRFLDSLYKVRDSNRVIVVLTSDHGIAKIPEVNNGARVDFSMAVKAARGVATAGGGESIAVEFESGGLFVDRDSIGTASVESIAKAFIDEAGRDPGILRIDRFADLSRADTTKDEIARRWLHMFPPGQEPVLVVTLKPGNLFGTGNIASHGSPHRYDSWVPLIFYGRLFKPGRYSDPVRTVDLAPTLARVLGITPGEKLDGVPLSQALR